MREAVGRDRGVYVCPGGRGIGLSARAALSARDELVCVGVGRRVLEPAGLRGPTTGRCLEAV